MRSRKLRFLLLTFSLAFSNLSPAQAAPDTRVVDVTSVTWLGAKAADATIAQVETAIRNEVGPRWSRYTTFEGSTEDKSISFTLGQTLQHLIRALNPAQNLASPKKHTLDNFLTHLCLFRAMMMRSRGQHVSTTQSTQLTRLRDKHDPS